MMCWPLPSVLLGEYAWGVEGWLRDVTAPSNLLLSGVLGGVARHGRMSMLPGPCCGGVISISCSPRAHQVLIVGALTVLGVGTKQSKPEAAASVT